MTFKEYCSSFITPQMTLLEKFNALLKYLEQLEPKISEVEINVEEINDKDYLKNIKVGSDIYINQKEVKYIDLENEPVYSSIDEKELNYKNICFNCSSQPTGVKTFAINNISRLCRFSLINFTTNDYTSDFAITRVGDNQEIIEIDDLSGVLYPNAYCILMKLSDLTYAMILFKLWEY